MTNNIEFPTIAGVEKKEPMTFEQASGGKVNPHYDKGGGYHRNCQVCVAVFEARMRGYDIEAKPYNKFNRYINNLRKEPTLSFTNAHVITFPGSEYYNEPNNYYEAMKKWLNKVIKPGERYGLICKIVLKPGGQDLYDHILIVYKTKYNELRFYDPQNGIDSVHYFNIRFFHIDGSIFYPQIFRLDNVDLNIEYLNHISRAANQ